jgi:GNAT superfamily N-acetyltransferase
MTRSLPLADLVRVTERPLPRPWPRLGDGPQLEYEFWIGDERCGRLVLAVESHWIGYVEVEPEWRGIGLGMLLHALVAARHGGWLTLELECSPSESRTIDALVRAGWRRWWLPANDSGTRYYQGIAPGAAP